MSAIGSGLTVRQLEIARLLGQGMGNKEIAEKLFISIATVETHRANIFRALDVHTIVQLVHWLYRNNLLQTEDLPDAVSPANPAA